MRRHEFKVTSPLLVVAPAALLDFWEGEWHFWADMPKPSSSSSKAGSCSGSGGQEGGHGAQGGSGNPLKEGQVGGSGLAAAAKAEAGINMMVYTGNSSARQILHDAELWLNPSTMDGKLNVGACLGSVLGLVACGRSWGTGGGGGDGGKRNVGGVPHGVAVEWCGRVDKGHGPSSNNAPQHACVGMHNAKVLLRSLPRPARVSLACAQQVRQRMGPDGTYPLGRLPKPDVVLAAYEAVEKDVALLRAVPWEAMVLDLRHRCGVWRS